MLNVTWHNDDAVLPHAVDQLLPVCRRPQQPQPQEHARLRRLPLCQAR